jgi:ABC-type nitrate/sulfonate/bicarbonate transport system ATPase subunit
MLEVTRREGCMRRVSKHKEDNFFVTYNINQAVALEDRLILMSPKYASMRELELPNYSIEDAVTKGILRESKEFEDTEIGDKIGATPTH